VAESISGPGAGPASTNAAGGAVAPRRSTRQRRHRFPGRSVAVSARFTVGEYQAICGAAGRADLSPTAYVGTAAVAAATGAELPGAALREALTELMQARTAVVRIGVAVNKLAAKALADGETTATELQAAATATGRSVALLEEAAGRAMRRLA
jgi:hypothetical protein